MVRRRVAVDLEPSGRQIDLGVDWTRALASGSVLRIGARLIRERGHVAGRNPEAVVFAGRRIGLQGPSRPSRPTPSRQPVPPLRRVTKASSSLAFATPMGKRRSLSLSAAVAPDSNPVKRTSRERIRIGGVPFGSTPRFRNLSPMAMSPRIFASNSAIQASKRLPSSSTSSLQPRTRVLQCRARSRTRTAPRGATRGRQSWSGGTFAKAPISIRSGIPWRFGDTGRTEVREPCEIGSPLIASSRNHSLSSAIPRYARTDTPIMRPGALDTKISLCLFGT